MRVHNVRDFASLVRGRRIDAGMSQAELARRAGVSRKWVHEFERGKPTAELSLVLRALEALGLGLEIGVPSEDDAGPLQGSGRAEPGTRPEKRIDLDQLLDEYDGDG